MPHNMTRHPLDDALWAAFGRGGGKRLADQLGATVYEVSRWRHGQVIPVPATQAKIVKVLNPVLRKRGHASLKVKDLFPPEDKA